MGDTDKEQDQQYAKDVREVNLPRSEAGMSNEQIANRAVTDLRASLAEDVSEGKISAEAADKVINDQIEYHRTSLDDRAHSSGQLSDNIVENKKLHQDD